MPRVRLRELVTSIEKRKRRVVYTDFEDEIGLGRTIDFAGFDGGPDYERFLRKVRAYVIERKDTVSLRKVYNNFALIETDIDDLRRIHEAAVGSAADEERAAHEAGGFGMFIRSLVGLERNAAKEAFAGFLEGKQYNATQIEFSTSSSTTSQQTESCRRPGSMRAPSRISAPPAPTVCAPLERPHCGHISGHSDGR